MREVVLPSGAVLKITVAPFADSKRLCQAVLRQASAIQLADKLDIAYFLKDVFCLSFSSPEIEAALWECFKRCTYNSGDADAKISSDTFEDVKARDDYMVVCIEVAKDNIFPFMKSLYAQFSTVVGLAEGLSNLK